jgi:hypothetical protein
MALQPFVGPPPLFSFLILYTIGRTPWTGDQPFARPLPIHRTTQTQNKRTQSSMPRVGFEHTTPLFERAKTVHPLDRAATVINRPHLQLHIPEYNIELLMNDRISPLVKQVTRNNGQIFFSTRKGSPWPFVWIDTILTAFLDTSRTIPPSSVPRELTVSRYRARPHIFS